MPRIEATQKKLREARFFLRQIEVENRRAVRNEPEAFDFYFSAFVSAARSVTLTLQSEEKAKYDQWFSGWLSARSEEDRQLLNLMKSQRGMTSRSRGWRS